MKKFLPLFLSAIMCICLCACGGSESSSKKPIQSSNSQYEEIEEALLGYWGYILIGESYEDSTITFYEFRENGKATMLTYKIGGTGLQNAFNWKVDYEITEDKIILTVERDIEDKTDELVYTYENGELSLSKFYYTEYLALYEDDWFEIANNAKENGKEILQTEYQDYIYKEPY